MKIFCLSILFKPILFRLFFRVDYEFEVYKFLNLQGKPQFSKIRKKQAIFGILPTFWLFLASRKNFFIGVPSYLNLLIELIILVPNLMGLEKKLYGKFWCAKGIYYSPLARAARTHTHLAWLGKCLFVG